MTGDMKHIALITLLAGTPGLAHAQAQSDADEGLSLMERGAQMFFDGMMREMAPALDDLSGLGEQVGPALRSFAREMGPALADLLEEVEDWSVYDAPEILPNGDIIIRRKPETAPADPETPTPPGPDPEEAPPAIYLDETPDIEI